MMKRAALAFILCAALAANAFAQGGMAPGPGTPHTTGGGGSPASFTKQQNVGFSGVQATSPYVISGATFNTSGEVPVVALINSNDFASGVVTGVSVVGPGSLTCAQGTNNANEQAWLCYGPSGTLTTANISISFTGTFLGNVMTGKVTTTTATPSGTDASPGSLAGTTTPATFQATGGVPTNGVGVCVAGDFFTGGTRTFSASSPISEYFGNDAAGNGEGWALGSTTTSGGSSGVTFNTSPTSAFVSWACASWSP